jgi:hypothetical protein
MNQDNVELILSSSMGIQMGYQYGIKSNAVPIHRKQILFYDNVGLQHLRRL